VTFGLPHRIRPAHDGDLPLVVDAWVQDYRHAPTARGIRDRDYYGDQRAEVLRILRASSTRVACAEDDPEHLFGFVTFGPGPLLHWVYVKDAYRRAGLGDTLLDAAFPQPRAYELYATHASRMWWNLEPPPGHGELARLRREGKDRPAGALTRRRIFYRPALLERRLEAS
jgi:GNAT superfamily N-acetyltransferase